MSYAFKASLAAAIMLVSAGCSPNADRVKATITTIDRTCDIVETTYAGAEKVPTSSRTYTDACSSIEEWSTVKKKRNKRVSGKATVHVAYTAPSDGSYQTGEFHLTGRDDEFYELKAGDEVEILVSKTDPTKMRKA